MYFQCSMRIARNISLRIFVTAAFALGSLGIPLYQHVCSTMKTRSFAASCKMRHKPKRKKACCMADEAAKAGISPNAVSQGGPGSSGCCSQVDMTKSISDEYTVSQSTSGATAMTIDAIPAGATLAFGPILILKHLTRFPGSSPPIFETKYLLDEVFLI